MTYVNEIAALLREGADPTFTEADLCRTLMQRTFAALGPAAVFLSEVTPSNTVRLVASFGLSEKSKRRLSEIGGASTERPTVKALVNNSEIWVAFDDPVWKDSLTIARDEDGIAISTFISHPIKRFGGPVGAINIACDGPVASCPDLVNFIDAVCCAISLIFYTKHMRSGRVRERPRVLGPLTPRQFQVLRLIAENHTNKEIADFLGYSESTIRQETIEIYARLGVAGRIEARDHYLASHGEFAG